MAILTLYKSGQKGYIPDRIANIKRDTGIYPCLDFMKNRDKKDISLSENSFLTFPDLRTKLGQAFYRKSVINPYAIRRNEPFKNRDRLCLSLCPKTLKKSGQKRDTGFACEPPEKPYAPRSLRNRDKIGTNPLKGCMSIHESRGTGTGGACCRPPL